MIEFGIVRGLVEPLAQRLDRLREPPTLLEAAKVFELSLRTASARQRERNERGGKPSIAEKMCHFRTQSVSFCAAAQHLTPAAPGGD